jgi:hypothetical protein
MATRKTPPRLGDVPVVIDQAFLTDLSALCREVARAAEDAARRPGAPAYLGSVAGAATSLAAWAALAAEPRPEAAPGQGA